MDEVIAIAKEFKVSVVGVTRPDDAARVRAAVSNVDVVVGDDGLATIAAHADADVVVNAVVGFAGLTATLATLEAGRRLALANKESLVAAAPLVERVRQNGEILPIDSEHCALHQCLASSTTSEGGYPSVARLLLTASGGPFRGRDAASLRSVTRDEALEHPTWSMGPKISIDSSTLMNKGLEVLEASALFGIEPDRIDVVVHPQSIVHSMVEFVDGSTIAQLSNPDMRLPIAYCLGYPERLPHAWGALSFATATTLTFEPPDRVAFPALNLAYEAGRRGDAAPAWLSAANEVAVDAFLNGTLAWSDIVPVVADTLARYEGAPLRDVEQLRQEDADARRVAQTLIGR